MRQYDEEEKKNKVERLHATLMLIAFGLTVLAFLVAIERPEWFHIRPVSATAMAMSLASTEKAEATKP
jgi:hypothetical protein